MNICLCASNPVTLRTAIQSPSLEGEAGHIRKPCSLSHPDYNLYVYVYVYVYVCVCMYVYIYIYIYNGIADSRGAHPKTSASTRGILQVLCIFLLVQFITHITTNLKFSHAANTATTIHIYIYTYWCSKQNACPCAIRNHRNWRVKCWS